jgi:hypothetical protein
VNSIFEKLFTGTADYEATHRNAKSRCAIDGIKPTFTLCLPNFDYVPDKGSDEEEETLKDALSEAVYLAKKIRKMCESDNLCIKKKTAQSAVRPILISQSC